MILSIILGLLAGVAAMIYGFPELQTDWRVYADMHSFVLVAGGTLACAIVSSSFKDLLALISILSGWMFIKRKKINHQKTVKILVKISEAASRKGKNSILNMGKGVGDGFLNRGLQLVGAGLDKDFVRNALETDIEEEKKRHAKHITAIRAMGSYAPMFGMMGTVMGVMQVLRNITDISTIVSGMSLALLTTLYGLILSSLYFIPLANKLKSLNNQEALDKEIMKEGILAIMDEHIPLKVETLLMAYLSTSLKKKDRKK